jgi:hypothetical protein
MKRIIGRVYKVDEPQSFNEIRDKMIEDEIPGWKTLSNEEREEKPR